MTEAEWLACTDPAPMLRSLNMRLRSSGTRQGRPPDPERFRLFACECGRRLWHLLAQEDQEALRVLEAYIQTRDHKDRFRVRKVHRPAGSRASNAMWLVSRDHPTNLVLRLTTWAKNLATSAVWEATAKKPTSAGNAYLSAARAVGALQQADKIDQLGSKGPSDGAAIDWQLASEDELAVQANLLRDIFGNPFRPSPPLPPAVLGWNDGTVRRIAEGIYEERAFDRLPILADALLDAGCDNEELIAHCRSAGPHVRGCWALDLILGKS